MASDVAAMSEKAAVVTDELTLPLTLFVYASGSRISRAAASPFRGSVGLGYSRSCGRKVSKMFNKSAQTVEGRLMVCHEVSQLGCEACCY